MGFFSKFERRVEDGFDEMGDKFFDAPISPVQIAKKAEKQMRREKMVGAGKEYAPTLYTVLVNPDDDERLFGYYPTLAGETETYLRGKAQELGLVMDGSPLVRFITGFRPHRLTASRGGNAALRPFRAGCRRSHSRKHPYAPELRPTAGLCSRAGSPCPGSAIC